MKFRVARHCTSLEPIIQFYHNLLGLEILGDFKDHEGYSAVFFGQKGAAWHLEFTISADPPKHSSDEDDALIFYLEEEAYATTIQRFAKHKVSQIKSKNNYWHIDSSMYLDPEGFRVIVSKRNTY